MLNSIFNQSNLLEKSLDASWLRNEVTSNNIANVDTPNFKSSHVEFEDALKDAINKNGITMKTTRPGHLTAGGGSNSDIEPKVVLDDNTTMRMDGNNVDIESEQLNLAKNTIYYNTLVQKINDEFRRLKTVINEG